MVMFATGWLKKNKNNSAKTVLSFPCLVLRKITEHCLAQVKIFLEALVWKSLSGNWNVACELPVVSVTSCYPYDNALKVSSGISYWEAICIALGKVFYCISLPEFRIYQEELSEDLVSMGSAPIRSQGGASPPLHLWVAVGCSGSCEGARVAQCPVGI